MPPTQKIKKICQHRLAIFVQSSPSLSMDIFLFLLKICHITPLIRGGGLKPLPASRYSLLRSSTSLSGLPCYAWGEKFFLPDKGGAQRAVGLLINLKKFHYEKKIGSRRKFYVILSETKDINYILHFVQNDILLQKISLWELFGEFRIFTWTERSEVQFENFRNSTRGSFGYFSSWVGKVTREFEGAAPQ